MSASILPLFRRPQPRDWSTQELAEFYRVESALVQSGISVETDRGVSDEGEPWFVFCRGDNGDVLIHFARIDGVYVAVSAAFDGITRGSDFTRLVQSMLREHPLVHTPKRPDMRGRLFVHPAASLVALVATIFFVLSDGDAMAAMPGDANEDGAAPASGLSGRSQHAAIGGEAGSSSAAEKHMAAAVTAAAIAITLSQSSFVAAEGEDDLSDSSSEGRGNLAAASRDEGSSTLGTGLEHEASDIRVASTDAALQAELTGDSPTSQGSSGVVADGLVANIAAIQTLIQAIDTQHPSTTAESESDYSGTDGHADFGATGSVDSWLVSDEARLALLAWQGEDAAVADADANKAQPTEDKSAAGSAAPALEAALAPAPLPAPIDAIASLTNQMGHAVEITALDKIGLAASSLVAGMFDLIADEDFSFENLVEDGRGEAQPVQSGERGGTYDEEAGEIVRQFLSDHTNHKIVWTDDGSELVLFSEDDAPDAPNEVIGFYLWTHNDGSKTIVFGFFDPNGDEDFRPYTDAGQMADAAAFSVAADGALGLGSVDLAGFIDDKVGLLIG